LLVTAVLCFSFCSLYLVSAQPSGAPTPDYYPNDGTRVNQWVWPTASIAALQAGKTYSLGATISDGAYYEVNITFTVNSGCSTSYNSAGPAGNQGWRWAVEYYDTTQELPATPSTGISVWTGPTSFGTSRAGKVSFIFDYFDVCNCIFVDWIGFTTTDLNTTGTYHAHYWNGGTVKRETNSTVSKRCKRDSSLRKRHYICPGLIPNVPAGITEDDPCCFWIDPPAYVIGSNSLGSWTPGDDSTAAWSKRTTYYLYWININQYACLGIPSVGSYGTGGVQTGSALGVTYL